MSEQATYTARITAEAWQHNQAIEVDAPGDQEWTCDPDFVSEHQSYIDRQFARADEDDIRLFGVLDNDDVFAGDPAAPEWVSTWSGPFTIRLFGGAA